MVYIEKALQGFETDPADTDFQRGYLSALKAVRDFTEKSK